MHKKVEPGNDSNNPPLPQFVPLSPEEEAASRTRGLKIAQAMVDGLRKFAAEEAARRAAETHQSPPIPSPK